MNILNKLRPIGRLATASYRLVQYVMQSILDPSEMRRQMLIAAYSDQIEDANRLASSTGLVISVFVCEQPTRSFEGELTVLVGNAEALRQAGRINDVDWLEIYTTPSRDSDSL